MCPTLPPSIRGGYGPRVRATCALLAGAHRVGKRGVARLCRDRLGVPIGPAAVRDLQRHTAAALEPGAREAHAHVAGGPGKVDETGWREGTKRGWRWVAVAAGVTAFRVRLSRARAVLAEWKRVRDGTRTRRGFRQSCLGWTRTEVGALLRRGAAGGGAATAGACRERAAVEPARYTFAAVEGVEPANNAAERALRHAVCGRKTSDGTDSEAASRFVERVRAVVASCRHQGRDALGFRVDAVRAAKNGAAPPSLIPTGAYTATRLPLTGVEQVLDRHPPSVLGQ